MNLIDKNDFFLLEVLVKRNFSAKYKDSVLGVLWSIIRPLLMMLILTIVFSTMFRGSIENYPVYLLSGRCIFTFFSDAIGASMNSISSNKNVLQKTASKKYIFVLSSVISEFLNFIISLILLVGVMIVTKSPFYLTMPLSFIPIIAALFMITGLGLMLSILSIYFTDIKHLWGVIVMALMYSSAIFYPMSIVPEPFHQFLILNPVFWIVDQFRCFVYLGTFPSMIYMVNLLLLSVMILIFGMIVFIAHEKRVSMKF